VDFPMNTRLFLDEGERPVGSGAVPAEALLLSNYKTHVVTSCYYSE
jgi:hypothetical protein